MLGHSGRPARPPNRPRRRAANHRDLGRCTQGQARRAAAQHRHDCRRSACCGTVDRRRVGRQRHCGGGRRAGALIASGREPRRDDGRPARSTGHRRLGGTPDCHHPMAGVVLRGMWESAMKGARRFTCHPAAGRDQACVSPDGSAGGIKSPGKQSFSTAWPAWKARSRA